MRVAILLGLLLVATARPAVVVDETLELWTDFNNAWNEYVRESLGCPKGTFNINLQTCSFSGRIDLKARNKARKLAAKVFDLKE